MSPFMVSDEHIHVMVWAGLKSDSFTHPIVDRARADDMGRMLMRENMRSLAARYTYEKIDEATIAAYAYREPSRKHTPIEVMKAIDCYEYHACEHDEWRDSEAYAYCQRLRKHVYHMVPGYEEAAWGIPEPEKPKVIQTALRVFAVGLVGVPRGERGGDPGMCIGMIEAPDEASATARVHELFDRVSDLKLKEVGSAQAPQSRATSKSAN